MAELAWYISAKPIADDTKGTGSGGNDTPNQESTNKNKNESLAKSTAQILAVTSAKRSISYLASNVGKYSGNSRNQTIVNGATKLVGYGIAFAANPILGAVTVAFDAITAGLDYAYERKWERLSSAQAKARAGEGVGYRQ